MVIKGIYKKLNINRIILYLSGVFSTMPIITIHGRPLFHILFIFELILLAVPVGKSFRLRLGKNLSLLLYWFLWSLVSAAVGLVMSLAYPELALPIKTAIPKIILYIIFIFLWGSQGLRIKEHNKLLVRGVFAGCIANLIWGIIDAAGYYLSGKSLNNIIFSNYFSMRGVNLNRGVSLILATGQIRAAGFNYDPAHFGFICPLVAMYSLKRKNPYFMMLAIFGTIASASTTALVCVIAIAVFYILDNFFGSNRVIWIEMNKILLYILSILVIVGIIIFNWNSIHGIICKAVNLFWQRINNSYIGQLREDNVRIQFVRYLPYAVLYLGPLLLTGLGFGTAFFGYSHSSYVVSMMGITSAMVYDMENTYIAYLMDTGIVGMILFFSFMGRLLIQYRKKCKKSGVSITDAVLYGGTISVLMSFFFYHYIIFSPHILLQTASLSELDIESRSEMKREIRENAERKAKQT